MIPAANARTTPFLVGCCLVQIAAGIYFFSSLATNGYLPAPFIYDKSDTFMDLFSPMFWADHSGRYTIWGSFYPPINFLFLKAARWLLFDQYRDTDAFSLRDYAQPLIPYVLAAFVAATMFVFRSDLWRGFTGMQKLLLIVTCILSPPVLFTIERGNLIVFALGFFALALAKQGWTRAFAIGVLINIKPYFAVFLIFFALTQRPRELIACTVMAGVIFLATGVVLDENFLVMIQNLFQFSQDDVFSAREVLSLPSSVSVFSYVLRTYFSQGGSFSSVDLNIATMISMIEWVKWVTLGVLLLSVGLAGRRLPEDITLAAATILISNLGVSVGGYSFIFYIPLIPIFLRMAYWKICLICIALILLPLDIISLRTDNIGEQFSYLSGTMVSVDWQLSLGSVVRPLANFVLLLVVSFEVFKRYAWLPRRSSRLVQASVPG